MKKIFSLFILLVVLTFYNSSAYAQLLNENFDYSTGILTTISPTIWTESPTGSVDIKVITGNLTYSNYPSSGIGNMIALNGGNTRSGVITNFTNISGNGSKLYASFLLDVTSTVDLDATGDYLAAFRDTVGTSKSKRAYVYLDSISTSTFSIGLAKSSSSSLTWSGTVLDTNTTYLIVINYVFQSGSDAVNLWVNPALDGTEPSSDIQVTTGTDVGSLGGFHFFQRKASGDEDIDGLRIATTWSQAPLPVELTSFSASAAGNTVELKWNTATEVNNYGFEVQRSAVSVQRSVFEKIGFAAGHGNSNAPNNYSFTDHNVSYGRYAYRLKQIDTDGKYTYSKIVEVQAGQKPTAFALDQNYPNPFNPTTTITYKIAEHGFVNLKVYNILGQKVLSLVNQQQQPGVYHVRFNGSKLPSGVYIYRLEVQAINNSFSALKKFVLLK